MQQFDYASQELACTFHGQLARFIVVAIDSSAAFQEIGKYAGQLVHCELDAITGDIAENAPHDDLQAGTSFDHSLLQDSIKNRAQSLDVLRPKQMLPHLAKGEQDKHVVCEQFLVCLPEQRSFLLSHSKHCLMDHLYLGSVRLPFEYRIDSVDELQAEIELLHRVGDTTLEDGSAREVAEKSVLLYSYV